MSFFWVLQLIGCRQFSIEIIFINLFIYCVHTSLCVCMCIVVHVNKVAGLWNEPFSIHVFYLFLCLTLLREIHNLPIPYRKHALVIRSLYCVFKAFYMCACAARFTDEKNWKSVKGCVVQLFPSTWTHHTLLSSFCARLRTEWFFLGFRWIHSHFHLL